MSIFSLTGLVQTCLQLPKTELVLKYNCSTEQSLKMIKNNNQLKFFGTIPRKVLVKDAPRFGRNFFTLVFQIKLKIGASSSRCVTGIDINIVLEQKEQQQIALYYRKFI